MSTTDQLAKYRDYLVLAIGEAQRNYDKTVIALAGGGLAVSIALVDKVLRPGNVQYAPWLFWAWMSWLVSLGSSLLSFYMSRVGLTWTLKQLDSGKLDIRDPGGFRGRVTERANILAGVAFFAGVILISLFTLKNLGGRP